MDPIILIFGGVTLFVLFRLYSALGTRTGHEQRRDSDALGRATKNGAEKPAQDEHGKQERAAARRAPAPVSPAAEPLRAADPEFDEKAFLAGARAAYEMIVEAFAAGDIKSLRPYLDPSVYEAFRTALAERDSRGQSLEFKFVGVESARIASSEARDGVMSAVTDFSSNQVRVVRDRDGAVIDGDPARIDLVKDRWTFARKIGSADPNWILVATGAAA